MDRLKEKLGPFPIWVWVLLGVGAIVLVWYLQKQGLLSGLGGGGSSSAAPASGGSTGLGGMNFGNNPNLGALSGNQGPPAPAGSLNWGNPGKGNLGGGNPQGGPFQPGNPPVLTGGDPHGLPVFGSPNRGGSTNWAVSVA